MTFLLIIIYLAFINLGLPDALLGSSWPVMHKEMNMPLSAAGILSFIVCGGTIISSLLSSKIINKFGTGLVTLVSVCLTGSALFGFSVSNSFYVLIVLCIPLGLGAGSVDSALNNFVALHYKAKHMSFLHSFWGIGATIGPVLISLLMGEELLWRRGYSVISVIQLCMIIILIISLPLWKKVKSETNVDLTKENAPNVSNRKALKIPGVAFALTTFLCYCAVESTAGLWSSSYLVTQRGINPQQAANCISFYYGGIAVGRILSGFLSSILSSKSLIRLGQIVSSLGIILLFFPLENYWCIISFVLIGLGFAPIYPSTIHETPIRFGKLNSQTVIGLEMGFAYIGSTFFPPIFGLIAEKTTLSIFPFVLILLVLAMTFTSEKINSFMKKKSL